MFAAGALAVTNTAARKIIHNQNPFYSFVRFLDMPSVQRWGTRAIIAGSRFGADRLRAMGWDGPLSAVRVFVDPAFGQEPLKPRPLQVALMTRKRSLEARLIRGILRSRRPEVGGIPWQAIANVTRPEAAEVVKSSAVFLSLSEKEGLGLPPLEALSAGCVVVGYHGDGGREYATPENGDWFEDGHHVEIAERVADILAAMQAGEQFETRRLAGAATAASFSPARFEAELREAWEQIFALG
jgi:glycosyltransferase involved in cell wall biosynthesis